MAMLLIVIAMLFQNRTMNQKSVQNFGSYRCLDDVYQMSCDSDSEAVLFKSLQVSGVYK